jgi:uncharacterized protein YecE (DUF72 family)
MAEECFIGTAGWSISSATRSVFPDAGSQLERYSARFSCVEINSSFYRPHRVQTYARWAASTPPGFRFAVKAPRAITHEARLRNAREPLAAFVDQIGALGSRLGPMLIQLPPSLHFYEAVADAFLSELRLLFPGDIVWEPRHPSWFDLAAETLLADHRIARVAADPACCTAAAAPGGWRGFGYWRLHGSPRKYYTAYGEERLRPLSEALSPGDWCVFDNTAAGSAIVDALLMQSIVRRTSAAAPHDSSASARP